ncbi:MAG: hypothetical protein AAFR16_09110 [Pseudomonadota bacterium]
MRRLFDRLLKALFGATAAGLAATALSVAFVAFNPTVLENANLGVFDQFQRLAPREPLPDTPVRIIAIDTESLEARAIVRGARAIRCRWR